MATLSFGPIDVWVVREGYTEIVGYDSSLNVLSATVKCTEDIYAWFKSTFSNLTGWVQTVGSWSVSSGYVSNSGLANSILKDGNDLNATSYRIFGKFKFMDGSGSPGVFFDGNSAMSNGMVFYYDKSVNLFKLVRKDSSVDTVLRTASVTLSVDTWYYFKVVKFVSNVVCYYSVDNITWTKILSVDDNTYHGLKWGVVNENTGEIRCDEVVGLYPSASNGGDVMFKYFLSNDDGVTWEEFSKDISSSFVSTGKKLKGRVKLYRKVNVKNPFISDYDITYVQG